MSDEIIKRIQAAGAGDPDETTDLEQLAAMRDGTLSLADVDDATLARLRARFGSNGLFEFLDEARQATAELGDQHADSGADAAPAPILTPRFRQWASAMAAVLLVAVGIWAFAMDQDSLVPSWPSSDPFAGRTAGSSDYHLGGGGQDPSWSMRPRGIDDFDPQLARRARQATVTIHVGEQIASGVLLADRWILTVFPVVAAPVHRAALAGTVPTVEVTLTKAGEGDLEREANRRQAQVHATDPSNGTALLRLATAPGRPGLEPAVSPTGSKRFTVGMETGGEPWRIRSAQVLAADLPTNLRQTLPPRLTTPLLHLAPRTTPSEQGGAILDETGKLVGLILASLTPDVSDEEATAGLGLPALSMALAQRSAPAPGTPPDLLYGPGDAVRVARVTPAPTDKLGVLLLRSIRRQSTGDGVRAYQVFLGVPDAKGTEPFGLWGAEQAGEFRFAAVIHLEKTGEFALGLTNDAGVVATILLDRDGDGRLDQVWTRSDPTAWTIAAASGPILAHSSLPAALAKRIDAVHRWLASKPK